PAEIKKRNSKNPNSAINRGLWTPMMMDVPGGVHRGAGFKFNDGRIWQAVTDGLMIPMDAQYDGLLSDEMRQKRDEVRKMLLAEGIVSEAELDAVMLVPLHNPSADPSQMALTVSDDREQVLHNRTLSFTGSDGTVYRLKGGGAASHLEEGNVELASNESNGKRYAFNQGTLGGSHNFWGGIGYDAARKSAEMENELVEGLGQLATRPDVQSAIDLFPWLSDIYSNPIVSFRPLMVPAVQTANAVPESGYDVSPAGVETLRKLNAGLVRGGNLQNVVWIKNPAGKLKEMYPNIADLIERQRFFLYSSAEGRTLEMDARLNSSADYRTQILLSLFRRIGIEVQGNSLVKDGRSLTKEDLSNEVLRAALVGFSLHLANLQSQELGATGGPAGRPSDTRNSFAGTFFEDVDTLREMRRTNGFTPGDNENVKDYL
ncbi:MAG TPA: hypothetical protein P5079_06965, partial [Elusimicrobiota bacterium]|nr:hypothetical protein [Elusimicrobiota bacterium]